MLFKTTECPVMRVPLPVRSLAGCVPTAQARFSPRDRCKHEGYVYYLYRTLTPRRMQRSDIETVSLCHLFVRIRRRFRGRQFNSVETQSSTEECALRGVKTAKPIWVSEHSCPSRGFDCDRDGSMMMSPNCVGSGEDRVTRIHIFVCQCW